MTWHALVEAEEAGLIEKPHTRLMGARISGPSKKPAHGGLPHGPAFTELEESEPYLSKEAQVAIRSTGGMDLSTTGSDAISATGLLARAEGIFAEPASASVVSCLAMAADRGEFAKDDVVVCVITGAGLKDAKAVSRISKEIRRVAVRSEAPAPRAQLGQTKFEILRSLSAGSTYGYGIWQDLRKSREITTASVYQHLAELEGMRLVRRRGATEAGGRERLLYELTRSGADLLTWSSRYEKEPGKGRE